MSLVLVKLLQVRTNSSQLAQLDELGAVVFLTPRPLGELSLSDQTGTPFGLERLRGEWSLVFFGFSNCPDMCPATLGQLERFHRGRLEAEQTPVNIVFVSIDPADSGEIIGEYLRDFHRDFIGLRGTPEQVAEFALQLHANTGFNGNPALGGHAMPADSPDGIISHSVHIAVVGPDANLVGLLRPPHRAFDIAEALDIIIRRA